MPSAEKPFTLLYVEDQDLNVQLVQRIIARHEGYRLLTAMRGGLALRLAREQRPDVILLDLNLPDIPGEEVVKRLRADKDLCDIPIVLVTGDVMGERVQRLMELGVKGCLNKPYRLEDFFTAVHQAAARV